jgi:hypothetical protein
VTPRGRATYLALLTALLLALILAPGAASAAPVNPGDPGGAATSGTAEAEVECGLVDFGCKAAKAINDAFIDLANKLVEAVADATVSLATFWMDTPGPELGQMAGGPSGGGSFQPSPTVAFIEGSVQWLLLFVAVLSVLLGAGRMAWERRAAPGRDLVASMLRLILVNGAGLAAVAAALRAANEFSAWIIGQATTDFGASLVRLLALEDADLSVMAVMLVILVAICALIASILQIALLIARNGFVIVLAGTWALSASATNTEQGRATYQKHTSWLIAFILYEPTAAIIYAAAFQLIDNAAVSGDPVGQAITGGTLMILALVALPALMRLVAPMVSAVAGGGGGGAGAAAAVAGGAAVMRSGRNAGGAAGGASGAGGGAKPKGASGSGRGPSGGGAGSAPGGGGTGPRPPRGGAPSGGGSAGGGAAGAGVGTLVRAGAAAHKAGNAAATGAGAPPPSGSGTPSSRPSNGGTP